MCLVLMERCICYLYFGRPAALRPCFCLCRGCSLRRPAGPSGTRRARSPIGGAVAAGDRGGTPLNRAVPPSLPASAGHRGTPFPIGGAVAAGDRGGTPLGRAVPLTLPDSAGRCGTPFPIGEGGPQGRMGGSSRPCGTSPALPFRPLRPWYPAPDRGRRRSRGGYR